MQNLGFYHNPEKISEIIDFIVTRILDHLSVEHDLLAHWG